MRDCLVPASTQSGCATSAPCVLSKGAKECGANTVNSSFIDSESNTLFSYQSRLSLQSQLTTISHLPLPLAQVTLPGYLKVCHTATSSAPGGRGPGLGASFPSFPSSCKSGIDTRTYQEGIPRYRVTTRSADGMWHNVHTPSEGMRPDR